MTAPRVVVVKTHRLIRDEDTIGAATQNRCHGHINNGTSAKPDSGLKGGGSNFMENSEKKS